MYEIWLALNIVYEIALGVWPCCSRCWPCGRR